MDALTGKDVFKMVGNLLHILGLVHGHNDIVMGIDELLTFTGDDILHILDVLDSKEVAGIRHRGMTVTLLIQQGEFSLLVRQEDNLVIDQGVNLRNMVKVGHDIDRHDTIVDSHVNIGTENTGKADRVHIQQAVDLGLTMTHMDALAVNLEIVHADSLVTEIKGKEAVGIDAGSFDIKEGDITDATILQLVGDLTDLDLEIAPLAIVIRQQGALLIFLGNNNIGGAVSIQTTVEETEIGVGEIETALVDIGVTTSCNLLHVELLPDKDILLMEAVALTKGLQDIGHQGSEIIIAVNIGRILLHRIVNTHDGTELTSLGVYHTNAVNIFDAEIDILEDIGTLAARSEGIDGNSHPDKDGKDDHYHEYCYHIINVSTKVILKEITGMGEDKDAFVDSLAMQALTLLDEDEDSTNA